MKDSSKEKKKEMVCIPECREDNGRRSKILQRVVIKVFKRGKEAWETTGIFQETSRLRAWPLGYI